MRGLLKMMTIGAVLLGSYTAVHAQSGNSHKSGQHKFVQKLDKKVDLDSKQEKRILQIKQKEEQSVRKYQNKIDNARLKSKTKIDKKLTPEQRSLLEKKHKKGKHSDWKKGKHSFVPKHRMHPTKHSKTFPPRVHHQPKLQK